MDSKVQEQMTVVIAGRNYPLKINEGEEDVIEKVVGEINEKIKDLQKSYSGKDKQDCLSMALLTYAFQLDEARQQLIDNDLKNKVNKLDNLINRLLSV